MKTITSKEAPTCLLSTSQSPAVNATSFTTRATLHPEQNNTFYTLIHWLKYDYDRSLVSDACGNRKYEQITRFFKQVQNILPYNNNNNIN